MSGKKISTNKIMITTRKRRKIKKKRHVETKRKKSKDGKYCLGFTKLLKIYIYIYFICESVCQLEDCQSWVARES